jgi:ABC-type methionine transport system ATPase subunit
MASAKVILRFPKEVVDKPITSTVVKKYSLDFNILKAYITPEEEGLLVLEDQTSFKTSSTSLGTRPAAE